MQYSLATSPFWPICQARTDQLLRHAVVETLPIVAGREGLGHQLLAVAAALGLDSQVWTAQSLSAACYWTPTTGWSGNLR